jgi:phage terminase small subunit
MTPSDAPVALDAFRAPEGPTGRSGRAPAHLAPRTRRWWASVVSEYELEPHHIRLLTLACESWDRGQQARAVLDLEGISYIDRFGAPRSRPEVAVERDSRIAFARLLRELDLDVETRPDPRPPRGGRR